MYSLNITKCSIAIFIGTILGKQMKEFLHQFLYNPMIHECGWITISTIEAPQGLRKPKKPIDLKLTTTGSKNTLPKNNANHTPSGKTKTGAQVLQYSSINLHKKTERHLKRHQHVSQNSQLKIWNSQLFYVSFIL